MVIKNVLLADESKMHRDVIMVGLSNNMDLKVTSIPINVNSLSSSIQKLNPIAVVLGIEAITDEQIITLRQIIKQILIPTFILSNNTQIINISKESSFCTILSRPIIGDMVSFDKTIDYLSRKISGNSRTKHHKLNVASATSNVGKNTVPITPIFSTIANMNELAGRKVIAIGSSTGGAEATYSIMTTLPGNLPPILITQHMPPMFTQLYAERLNMNSRMEVREAKDGDELYQGLALVAQGGLQMKLVKRGNKRYVECKDTELYGGLCPSVDVLFNSVADIMGKDAIGVILTGMGKDGAYGLKNMRDKGAKTIGQNEETSVVYGMPKVAFEINAVERQAPIEEIAHCIGLALKEERK